jgi:hypothetical protein
MKFLKRNPITTITQIDNFPTIGTVEDPAYAWVGRNLLLAYQIAPVDGGGCALVLFTDASDVSIFPLNVEGFGKNKSGPYVREFAIQPWQINEISGDPKTQYWKVLKLRRWMISFEDFTMDIVFEDVELKEVSADIQMPDQMLLERIDYLRNT